MTTKRPPITLSLVLADFEGWYWLKTDLVLLCRTFHLSTRGNKLELEDRLRRHLSGSAEKGTVKRRIAGAMPEKFISQTVIGEGWRCNPALGAYFRSVFGSGFRFNASMRDFIHNCPGRTLADAAVCFRASTLRGTAKPLIPAQLEYNQHFRDFFAANPGATRKQAIASWWEKRSRRGGTRSRID